MLLGPQQQVTRPPPRPPSSSSTLPSSTANNNNSAAPVTLNPDIVAKFTNMMNQNDSTVSTSQAPPLPPRDVLSTNPGGTVRRPPPPPLSEFVDNVPAERRPDQSNSAALDYDHEFESRFRFTPIENLPPPQEWKPPPRPRSVGAK